MKLKSVSALCDEARQTLDDIEILSDFVDPFELKNAVAALNAIYEAADEANEEEEEDEESEDDDSET